MDNWKNITNSQNSVRKFFFGGIFTFSNCHIIGLDTGSIQAVSVMSILLPAAATPASSNLQELVLLWSFSDPSHFSIYAAIKYVSSGCI
jgi:hypothetical protein